MKVSEILSPNVEVIAPDLPIREAAERMRSLDVGALPVCDGARLVGMITDRDITVRAVADGWDLNQKPVRDAMTPDIQYVFDDDDIERAAQIMEDKQIRRLPVLNHDKRLVGILAQADIARTGKDKLAGDLVEKISDPDKQPSEARG